MARTVLEVLFKQFRDNLQKNSDFRKELNTQTVHYIEQDIEALKSQISSVGVTAERDFNKKYAAALKSLQDKGMTDLTFNRIQSVLKKEFLNNFTDLAELGVDVGHVEANLTIASKVKATEQVFGQELSLRRNNIDSLSDQDLQDVAKTIALMSTYIGTLEQLDKIQDRKGLIKFLKNSGTFKKNASSADLSTLDSIKSFIGQQFSYKGSKGFSDLSREILSGSLINIDVDTTVNLKRKITATSGKVAVTFEVAAFNRLKGSIAKDIKGAFTEYLDTIMKDPQGLPKHLNDALVKSIKQEFTKEQFAELFPNVSASKTIIEVVEEIVVGTLKGIKFKNYSASKTLPNKVIPSVTARIKVPKIKVKVPKAVNKPLARKKVEVSSLLSLQNLLNGRLVQQVKKNMGRGDRRDILNLRTGRFAESVKVERLSQSREGMITAFYSYMKNPYATFSTGGLQGTPATRDPKLLIAKSIREIAAEQVQNRLRSVVI